MKNGKLTPRRGIRREWIGLLVMLGIMLGVIALRYALFLPQYIH